MDMDKRLCDVSTYIYKIINLCYFIVLDTEQIYQTNVQQSIVIHKSLKYIYSKMYYKK